MHDTILCTAMSCALAYIFSFWTHRGFTHCGRMNVQRLTNCSVLVRSYVCTPYTYLSFHHVRMPKCMPVQSSILSTTCRVSLTTYLNLRFTQASPNQQTWNPPHHLHLHILSISFLYVRTKDKKVNQVRVCTIPSWLHTNTVHELFLFLLMNTCVHAYKIRPFTNHHTLTLWYPYVADHTGNI